MSEQQATRPGKPRKAPTDQWTIYVPQSLGRKVDLLFLNPVSGKIRYGYRTALVNQLLKRWLEERVALGRLEIPEIDSE